MSFLAMYSMKRRWLAHNLLMLPLAGKSKVPFHLAGIVYLFVFLTLLAGQKPSHMIAGWDFYFPKVFLARCEERLSFFQES